MSSTCLDSVCQDSVNRDCSFDRDCSSSTWFGHCAYKAHRYVELSQH